MRIFVTGAAGLIGGELVSRLLDNGHSVLGMVRSNRDIRSNAGQLLSAMPFNSDLPAKGALQTIQGDISNQWFGMERTSQQYLAGNIDMVIHCAAMTSFDADPAVQDAINVQGTRNALDLFPATPFLHVSTAYTCGLQNGAVREAQHGPETKFMNGYEKSKARAEALVMERSSNYAIARPSIVVGEHETGQIKSFDTIYTVFRLIAEGRISAIPANVEASLDFVPIDHVVGGLVDIVNHWDEAAGKVFHLSSGNPVPPTMLVDAIDSFDQLSKPVLVPNERFSAEKLPPRERRLYKMTASHYASYFARKPNFDTNNLSELSGRTCPAIDQFTLQRMIKFCIDAGFLGVRKSLDQRTSG
jgi:nucleoside-diphosphate-sugar epimerase